MHEWQVEFGKASSHNCCSVLSPSPRERSAPQNNLKVTAGSLVPKHSDDILTLCQLMFPRVLHVFTQASQVSKVAKTSSALITKVSQLDSANDGQGWVSEVCLGVKTLSRNRLQNLQVKLQFQVIFSQLCSPCLTTWRNRLVRLRCSANQEHRHSLIL